MIAATLLTLLGVSRSIYHLITSKDAILIVKSYKYVVACLACILFHWPNKITLSVCMSVCLSVCLSVCWWHLEVAGRRCTR